MKIKEYTEICKKFAKETQCLRSLNGDFWMTHKHSFYASRDARLGGIDVSWAFHLSDKDIEAMAPQKFVDLLVRDLFDAGCPISRDVLNKITDQYQ